MLKNAAAGDKDTHSRNCPQQHDLKTFLEQRQDNPGQQEKVVWQWDKQYISKEEARTRNAKEKPPKLGQVICYVVRGRMPA